MYPYHKEWAVKRYLTRLEAFARDLQRGKLRGLTREEAQVRTGFYGANIHPCFDRIDVRITSMHRIPDQEIPYTNFGFKCLQCGHHELRFPTDFADQGTVSCPSCKTDICTYGELKAALSFIAMEEYRYGEPEKYLQQGADNEPAAISEDSRLAPPEASDEAKAEARRIGDEHSPDRALAGATSVCVGPVGAPKPHTEGHPT